jgi:AcrR family transcriptional regulator
VIDIFVRMPHPLLVPTTDDPLLDAAHDLSERDPSWTMTALARGAGVSRATLYRRFPSRDAVVAALAHRGHAPADLSTRVFDAFEQVAARRGIPATTIADVAAAAGCSVATVYRRFASREGLVTAYAAARTPRALLGELTLDPSGPLRELLHVLATHATAHLTAHRATLDLAFAPSPEERPIVAHLRALEAEGRAQLAGWLALRVEAGELRGDPRALARAFVGMLAASVLAREGDDPTDPVDETAGLVDLFLDGCAGHGAAS